ncbi:MAG: hypothetical protein ACOCQC_01455 [Halanaerobiaceae bacterium]
MKFKDIRFNAHEGKEGQPYLVAESPGIVLKLKIELDKSVDIEEAEELAGYLENNITELSRAFF